MAVSAVSSTSWSNFFQRAGKVGVIVGTVTLAARVALGQNYTYPCAIAAVGACAWFSVWLNQSISQEALLPKAQEKPLKEKVKEVAKDVAYEFVDVMGDKFKAQLKVSSDKLVDASVSSGKLAAITYLPPGVGSLAGGSLDIVGGSINALSTRSINTATDSTKNLVKRSVDKVLQ